MTSSFDQYQMRADAERQWVELVRAELEGNGWNIVAAAAALGVGRNTMYYRLRRCEAGRALLDARQARKVEEMFAPRRAESQAKAVITQPAESYDAQKALAAEMGVSWNRLAQLALSLFVTNARARAISEDGHSRGG